MSLYQLQKFLYDLNRDPLAQQKCRADLPGLLGQYDYIQAMRDGVARYGPVRAGVYAMTTAMDQKVAGV